MWNGGGGGGGEGVLEEIGKGVLCVYINRKVHLLFNKHTFNTAILSVINMNIYDVIDVAKHQIFAICDAPMLQFRRIY